MEIQKKKSTSLGQMYRKIAHNQLKFDRKPDILDIPRKNASAFIQLKTSIGYIKSYFKMIGQANNNRCFDQCKSRQTTLHLILDCRLYQEERKAMKLALLKKGLPLTIQILFCTKIGKKALAEFLVCTEICTAKWYTNAGCIEE